MTRLTATAAHSRPPRQKVERTSDKGVDGKNRFVFFRPGRVGASLLYFVDTDRAPRQRWVYYVYCIYVWRCIQFYPGPLGATEVPECTGEFICSCRRRQWSPH